jgi:hypothetical protein
VTAALVHVSRHASERCLKRLGVSDTAEVIAAVREALAADRVLRDESGGWVAYSPDLGTAFAIALRPHNEVVVLSVWRTRGEKSTERLQT